MSKTVLIIPGTCSHKSNWLDQIYKFTAEGHKVFFLELNTHKEPTMLGAAESLFDKIGLLSDFQDSPSDNVIYCHSMGAMLILRILVMRKFFSDKNPETYNTIKNSKIVFIQMPLSTRSWLLKILDVFKFLLLPFIILYRLIVAWWLAFLLVQVKKFLWKFPQNFIVKVLQTFINLGLMFNSAINQPLSDFFNVINYYRDWQDFVDDHLNFNPIDHMLNACSQEGLKAFDLEATARYLFTTGSPEQFADSSLTQALAAKLQAQVIDFPWSFHSPQHFFWSWEKLENHFLSHD